jgi:hypothetical protein
MAMGVRRSYLGKRRNGVIFEVNCFTELLDTVPPAPAH